MRPKARTRDLVAYDIADETIVYDLRTHEAHCLGELAGLVWRLSDGQATVRQINAMVAARLGTTPNGRRVVAALRQLANADLLVAGAAGTTGRGPGRRRVLKSLAAAGAVAAGSLVTTIVVPKAAAALSCAAFHDPCRSDSDCCSGRCRGGRCQKPHGRSVGEESGPLGAACEQPERGWLRAAGPGLGETEPTE